MLIFSATIDPSGSSHPSADSSIVLLPDYDHATVSALLSLLYTGRAGPMAKRQVDAVVALAQDMAVVLKHGSVKWELVETEEMQPTAPTPPPPPPPRKLPALALSDHFYCANGTKMARLANPTRLVAVASPNEAEARRRRLEAAIMELEDRAPRVVGSAMLGNAWRRDEGDENDNQMGKSEPDSFG